MAAAAITTRKSWEGGISLSESVTGTKTDAYPEVRWLVGASSAFVDDVVVICLMPSQARGGGIFW